MQPPGKEVARKPKREQSAPVWSALGLQADQLLQGQIAGFAKNGAGKALCPLALLASAAAK